VKLSIILSTLLSTFATSSPDLCGDVYLDASGDPVTDSVGQTLSRFCKWTGPVVPTWNADVCCTFANNAATCTRTDTRGRCQSGTAKRYCEHGSLGADGRVSCFQPFPDACEAGFCDVAPAGAAMGASVPLCCYAGGCYELDFEEDCFGNFKFCDSPYTNSDGTVGCADND
jgi:hypothetical protein